MAKSTHSGPSFTDAELVDPVLPVVVRENLPSNRDRPVTRFQYGTLTELGGESSSAGSSSEQSSLNVSNLNKTPKQPRQEPAQTTESLSGPSQTGQDSTALSTGGNGPETEMESIEEYPPYQEWLKDDLIAECRERGLPVSGTKDDLAARLDEYDFELEAE